MRSVQEDEHVKTHHTRAPLQLKFSGLLLHGIGQIKALVDECDEDKRSVQSTICDFSGLYM